MQAALSIYLEEAELGSEEVCACVSGEKTRTATVGEGDVGGREKGREEVRHGKARGVGEAGSALLPIELANSSAFLGVQLPDKKMDHGPSICIH